MKARRLRVHLEELSSRILPSASTLALATNAPGAVPGNASTVETDSLHDLLKTGQNNPARQAGVAPASAQARVDVVGQGRGSYTARNAGVDAGTTYTFSGTVTIDGVGGNNVLTGTIGSVGLITQGTAGGTMTFSKGNDLLQIELTGPVQGAFAALPSTFTYQVAQATGVYQSMLGGKGRLLLTLGSPTANPGAGIANGSHGLFSILLGQSPSTIAGQVSGTYTPQAPVPDTGTTYNLQGSSSLAGLGTVVVSGSVHSVGSVSQGKAGGTLTFTRGSDHFTVQLVGPEQAGLSPLPTTFAYKVIEATGNYAPLLGQSGSVVLHLTPPPSPPVAPPGSVSPLWRSETGMFTLDFLLLSGKGQGNYAVKATAQDAGTAYLLKGTVNLDGLTTATLSGYVQSVGLIAQGHAHGTLNLSHGDDWLVMEVVGPNQTTLAGRETTFTYKVLDATGAYRRLLYRQGSLKLNLAPLAPDNHLHVNGTFNVAFV